MGQVYSASQLPDYVLLEQMYLSTYVLAYNVNRFASASAYLPSLEPVNVGVKNPSYGKQGVDAFVWGNTHSEALRAFWSSVRGKYCFFVYDFTSLAPAGPAFRRGPIPPSPAAG